MKKDLMTEDEVCDYLRVSPRTLFNWRKQGKIKAVWVADTCLRFRRSDVDGVIVPEEHGRVEKS